MLTQEAIASTLTAALTKYQDLILQSGYDYKVPNPRRGCRNKALPTELKAIQECIALIDNIASAVHHRTKRTSICPKRSYSESLHFGLHFPTQFHPQNPRHFPIKEHHPLQATSPKKSVPCTACQLLFPSSTMGHLPCGHSYCAGCARQGYNLALQTGYPFSCCGRLVPFDRQEMRILSKGQRRRYADLLREDRSRGRGERQRYTTESRGSKMGY